MQTVDVYVMDVFIKLGVEMQLPRTESVNTVARVSIIITAEVPEHLLNAYWEDPADLVINAFGDYYGSGDVHLHRIDGVIVDEQ